MQHHAASWSDGQVRPTTVVTSGWLRAPAALCWERPSSMCQPERRTWPASHHGRVSARSTAPLDIEAQPAPAPPTANLVEHTRPDALGGEQKALEQPRRGLLRSKAGLDPPLSPRVGRIPRRWSGAQADGRLPRRESPPTPDRWLIQARTGARCAGRQPERARVQPRRHQHDLPDRVRASPLQKSSKNRARDRTRPSLRDPLLAPSPASASAPDRRTGSRALNARRCRRSTSSYRWCPPAAKGEANLRSLAHL
jgi:hypothetical protein